MSKQKKSKKVTGKNTKAPKVSLSNLVRRLENLEEIKNRALSLVHYWQEENAKDDQLYGLDEERLERMRLILSKAA